MDRVTTCRSRRAAKGRMTMAEKIGVYVCHCGSNIAGKVDVEEVAKWAGENIDDVVVARDYKFMCSRSRPEDDRGRHQERGPDARRRGRLQPASARKDIPPRLLQRRLEPLSAGNDQHPRALLLGAQGPGSGHGEGQIAGLGGGRAGEVPGAAGADVCRCQSGHAGRRRRHRRPAGHAGIGRRRLPGLPGRATAVDRRPHGPVRQDVSHARLLGLHPDAQDVRGRPARERHAADLLRTGRSHRFGRQLQGQDPPEGAQSRLRPVHRLRHLRRKMPS